MSVKTLARAAELYHRAQIAGRARADVTAELKAKIDGGEITHVSQLPLAPSGSPVKAALRALIDALLRDLDRQGTLDAARAAEALDFEARRPHQTLSDNLQDLLGDRPAIPLQPASSKLMTRARPQPRSVPEARMSYGQSAQVFAAVAAPLAEAVRAMRASEHLPPYAIDPQTIRRILTRTAPRGDFRALLKHVAAQLDAWFTAQQIELERAPRGQQATCPTEQLLSGRDRLAATGGSALPSRDPKSGETESAALAAVTCRLDALASYLETGRALFRDPPPGGPIAGMNLVTQQVSRLAVILSGGALAARPAPREATAGEARLAFLEIFDEILEYYGFIVLVLEEFSRTAPTDWEDLFDRPGEDESWHARALAHRIENEVLDLREERGAEPAGRREEGDPIVWQCAWAVSSDSERAARTQSGELEGAWVEDGVAHVLIRFRGKTPEDVRRMKRVPRALDELGGLALKGISERIAAPDGEDTLLLEKTALRPSLGSLPMIAHLEARESLKGKRRIRAARETAEALLGGALAAPFIAAVARDFPRRS